MTESLLARLGDPAETLYLIDISSFIFRAFYAIRPLTSPTGEPTNAVYGVATMIAKLVEEAKPEHLSVVYDSKEPSFRKEIYKEYKANRTAPPDELIPQFARVEELIHCMEIPSYRMSGVEADDLIATLTKKWTAQAKHHRVVIVTSDKDLMQLVNERVVIWDTMKNIVFGPDEVVEKFGVKPSQIRDYLALVGDTLRQYSWRPERRPEDGGRSAERIRNARGSSRSRGRRKRSREKRRGTRKRTTKTRNFLRSLRPFGRISKSRFRPRR